MPNQQDLANAIRALSMDAVQAANCGHPGMQWEWQILPKFFGRNI